MSAYPCRNYPTALALCLTASFGLCFNKAMLDKWNGFWAKHTPSGLVIWNFVVFVPVALLMIGAISGGGGEGSAANVFLLLAMAPTALVLIGIDIYVLIKRFGKRR